MKNCFYNTQSLIESLGHLIIYSNDEKSDTARAYFEELTALLEAPAALSRVLTIEHELPEVNALWIHMYDRVLKQSLLGLERRDLSLFQREETLSQTQFDALCAQYMWLDREVGLGHVLRAALVFSDFAKGGNASTRASWQSTFGVNLSLHGQAAADILQKTHALRRFNGFGIAQCHEAIAIALVRFHGYIGQYIRGEITFEAFDEVLATFKALSHSYAESDAANAVEYARKAILTAYVLLNIIDTASVRAGLMDDALFERFIQVGKQLEECACQETRDAQTKEVSRADQTKTLADRLRALRAGAIRAGESPNAVVEALNVLTDCEFDWFQKRFQHCQIWYCEAATHGLSAMSLIKLLVLGMRNFDQSDKLYHVDMIHIAEQLNASHDAQPLERSRCYYRRRLLETMLSEATMQQIIDGSAAFYRNEYMLGLPSVRGSMNSCALSFHASEEANALITLLSIYEKKNTVAYHSALKLLCDLYHLRKDDFDRLANESQYLATMNAARDDKSRMLSWLKPGRILEIGPGGGVVLDLLENQFPDSEIIGLDASHQVVLALEQRRAKTNARWQILEGNAFELSKYVEASSLDGIVFCSILHEIYSYIEQPDGSRFHLESVRDMVRSAFEVLKPGGRIVIRDGIMPPHETRRIEFVSDDAKSFFEAFCNEFKGRHIAVTWLSETRVQLDAADAMEFLYTYTWGPESFPYEVREQYGIMTYTDYVAALQSWLGSDATIVPVPASQAQYLQTGYVQALSPRVRLTDENDVPAEFPPSNALIVIEKREAR